MWWQRFLERIRCKQDTAEPDIAFWRLQSMFNNFRRILELNNKILETVANMDRALGGEYIFDRAFLEQSVRRVASDVHHVVYSLNALTGNAYVPLYDRYQDIRTILDDILAGDVRALAGAPVLPLQKVGWELEPLAGIDAVCLAELHNHTGLPVAGGCVLTTEGVDILLKLTKNRCSVISSDENLSQRYLHGIQSVHSMTEPLGNSDKDRDADADQLREQLAEHIAELLQANSKSDQEFSGLRVVISRVNALVDDDAWADEDSDCRAVLCLQQHKDGGLSVVVEDGAPDLRGESGSEIPPDQLAISRLLALRTDTAAPESYVVLLESILHNILEFSSWGDTKAPRLSVLLVRSKMTTARGSVTSRIGCENPHNALAWQDALSITAIHSGDTASDGANGQTATADCYLLQRTYPFIPIQSEIAARQPGFRFPDGKRATSVMEGGSFRGSALLRRQDMQALAETAMTMERMLGLPVSLDWEFDASGRCRILRATPYRPSAQEDSSEAQTQLADALAEELHNATILARGGHMVQSGVVAGRAVHVAENMRTEDFPVGAIAVAQVASPRLTPILQRASAIICENGTVAGHLATVARELRLPTVFGIADVMERIPEGSEITLDAGETTLYAGVLPFLLQFSMAGDDLYPTSPEYHTLRRLLRFISPLHLVNPESPDFGPSGCRTFHDLIHYCHEKSVEELAYFQERRPGLGAIRTRSMQLSRPMDLRVLDIAGGLASDASTRPVPEDVRSLPFSAFLDGFLRKEGWDLSPVSLGIRDVISSMPHSMTMLSSSGNTLGENLAIVSKDYVNISLRLGYHFSVVDAYLGPDTHRNHVYFRFAGGLADPERRKRRARLIRSVLEDMGFKVVRKGDLVVGSLKGEDMQAMRSALFVLGGLTAFSRQRDTGLHSDADMHALYDAFQRLFLCHYDRFSPAYDMIARMDACANAMADTVADETTGAEGAMVQ
ncbi:PEP-utilizing enzyme [Halodesulfovibrio aestuarii]|uniref:PEP-utilizing enzyme n=1 Tax=Halodesulfovibrio aestuarii TaxID=126333 RepID=UPI0004134ACD